MNNVAANIVKGMLGRMRSTKSSNAHQMKWLQKKLLKHQDDQKVKTHSFKNFKVFYKRPYELLHAYHEIFEQEIYKFKCEVDNPVILDCGANIGISTLYFKQLFPNARLSVYEPDENNFALLTENCKINQFKDVDLHKAAIWINNGTISFDAKESEGSHISESNNSTNKVACVRFADLLDQYEKVHFVKMDIEGAEWKVMQDAAGKLNKIDNLFLEYHGKTEETEKLSDLFALLRNAGFALYIKMAADNLHKPFAEKSTGNIYDVQLNFFCYRK